MPSVAPLVNTMRPVSTPSTRRAAAHALAGPGPRRPSSSTHSRMAPKPLLPDRSARLMHEAPDDYPDDLKKEIFEAIGNIDHIEVFGQEILVAPYIQPPRRKSGLIVSQTNFEVDDKWMSKSFLVLKLGELNSTLQKSFEPSLLNR
jgi:hypothetical protein